jgi:hypothetical protein
MAEQPGVPAPRVGLFFGRKLMIRKLALLAVLALMLAPAFLMAGCQASSSDQPNALTGSSQASYPKYSAYNAR